MPVGKKKFQKGAIDLLIILGIAVLLGALPIAQKLVGESAENRGRATCISSGQSCTPGGTTSCCCGSCNLVYPPSGYLCQGACNTPVPSCTSGSCIYGYSSCGGAGRSNGSGSCSGGICCGGLKKYSCNNSTGNCVEDSNGAYSDINNCESVCSLIVSPVPTSPPASPGCSVGNCCGCNLRYASNCTCTESATYCTAACPSITPIPGFDATNCKRGANASNCTDFGNPAVDGKAAWCSCCQRCLGSNSTTCWSCLPSATPTTIPPTAAPIIPTLTSTPLSTNTPRPTATLTPTPLAYCGSFVGYQFFGNKCYNCQFPFQNNPPQVNASFCAPTSTPRPTATPAPVCTLNDKKCETTGGIVNAKQCKSYGGVNYWWEQECTNGCSGGVCNPVPTVAIPTNAPQPTSAPTTAPLTYCGAYVGYQFFGNKCYNCQFPSQSNPSVVATSFCAPTSTPRPTATPTGLPQGLITPTSTLLRLPSTNLTCPSFGSCPESNEGIVLFSCLNDNLNWRCMPDGRWEKELFSRETEADLLNRPCKLGESGIDIARCRYVCTAYGRFVKEYADCPVNRDCYNGEKFIREDGCAYTCKIMRFQKDDPNCECGPEGRIKEFSKDCQLICVDSKWKKANDCLIYTCEGKTIVSVDNDNKVIPVEDCKYKCYRGECIRENYICENNSVFEVQPDGKKLLIEDCVNGCVDSHCREIYYGSCKEGEKLIFPNNCAYTCRINFTYTGAKAVFWDKIDPNCRELYGEEIECRGNDVYKVKYTAGLGKSEKIKSCEYGCLYGDCTYPKEISCTPGQKQFDDNGNLVECVGKGLKTAWELRHDLPQIIAPGLSNLERQNLYYTMVDLPSWFLGKDKLQKIIITETFTELLNPDLKGINAWYNPYENFILLSDWTVNNKEVIVHELTHSLQFIPGSTLMKDWEEIAGWTRPNLDGSGISPSKPANAPTNYAKTNSVEDMAESAALYVTDPCTLLRDFPERYEFLKNDKRVFAGREYLPKGGCSKETSFLNKMRFLLIKEAHAQDETANPTMFERIIPGTTNESDVLRAFGQPTKTFYSADKDIFWYQTKTGKFQTVIFLNKVAFLVTIHFDQNSAENISKFGQADKETFNFYRYDTKTYIYDQKGLALTADQKGDVLVKQIFPIGQTGDFLNRWGKEFPDDSPYEQVKILKPGEEILPTPTPKFIQKNVQFKFFSFLTKISLFFKNTLIKLKGFFSTK